MTRKKKIGSLVAVVIMVAAGASIAFYEARKGIETVQAAPVGRKDLTSIVSATGEIRPKTYTNVLAEGFGKITEILAHEGQWVHQGDVLLRVESVQPAADVRAQQATIGAAQAALQAAEANLRAAQAGVAQQQANLDNAQFNWKQDQELYEASLISRQQYEAGKSAYDAARAAVAASQAQLGQARAQESQAKDNIHQAQAVLAHTADVLYKTTYRAPINGVVTYIAVRVGENVVPGIQNAQGAYLMTISDMSVVTAEVMVDETDIISVQLGQAADVQVDALPGRTFHGHVTQVGAQALIRSSGLATTQTTTGTAEAKDFKVIITLDNPPKDLSPGLTVTAKIQTAHKANVLAVPIQALVVRSQQQLAQDAEAAKKGGFQAVALADEEKKKTNGAGTQGDDVQGVFVIRNGRAVFAPVQTGIMGLTDIEVTKGLKAGDQIVVGSYQTLRALRAGAQVRIQQAPAATS